MSSSGSASGNGFLHETALYGDDDEFLAIVTPFIRDGVAASEPILVALSEHNTNLVRQQFGGIDGVTYTSDNNRYKIPATTIRAYQDA
ncbi:MAG: MEDS domain-containing protein, partial [Ilumatobacteraceae bacterium]